MCFGCCSKLLITKHWVIKIVMQRVPGHRADNRKRQTTELAVTMSWKDELVATDTAKTLTAGNIGSPPGTGAPCLKDTGGWSLQAYTGYRNVQSVQLRVTYLHQATVELVPLTTLSAAFSTHWMSVSGGHWRPGQHGFTVFSSQHEMWRRHVQV